MLLLSGGITTITRPAQDTPPPWVNDEPATTCSGFAYPTDDYGGHLHLPRERLNGRRVGPSILPSTTVIFFDVIGCMFLSARNIYIIMHHDSGHPYLSPSQYNVSQLILGDILNLMMTPPTRITSTICRHVTGFILPSIDNQAL